MVATNEFEDAWLDEGINSYTEVKILNDIFGADRSQLDLWGITEGDDASQRNSYRGVADKDPMAPYAYQYMDGSSYGGITYGKTATVLLTLEKVVGEDTMRRAIHTYFMRYRFTHPTREDFLQTVEEVSGKNLRWYFDQAVYGTQTLDYEVTRISSEPLNEKTGRPDIYRDQVVVSRKGDFIFPVTVEIKFADGKKVREQWDGRERWVRFMYDKPTRIESAEIDPDHQVYLDKDFFNNSKTVKADTTASRKLTNYWRFVSQWIGQMLASFV